MQIRDNKRIVEAISSEFNGKRRVYCIPHPDDSYDYGAYGAEILNKRDLNIRSDVIIGNNSSSILQYGASGFNILLYEKSYFLEIANQNVFGELKFVNLGGINFYSLMHTDGSRFWSLFICKSGHTSLESIRRSIK
jgi:hypothetical protein